MIVGASLHAHLGQVPCCISCMSICIFRLIQKFGHPG